jgi:hypothetical protein
VSLLELISDEDRVVDVMGREGGSDGAVDDMMRLGCVAKAACCCNRGRGTRSSYGDLERRVRQVQIIIWGPFIASHDTLA